MLRAHLLMLLTFAFFLGLSGSAAPLQNPAGSGPVALVIQYKCQPSQRVEFRRRLSRETLPHFEQLKSEGMLLEYHLLFSRYVDTNTWDALALLAFSSYEQVARWRHVEANMPAGLSEPLIAIVASIETYPVDLVRQAFSSKSAPTPVYFVIPYAYSVPTAAYLKYADDYVLPQFSGWMKEDVLSGYQLYLQRYTAGRPWDSLIVLKYKDDESFGRREQVVAKVRAQLQSDAVWRAASENKQNLRIEKEAVIADELYARD